MKITFKLSTVLIAACSALAGCTTADPTVYSGLASAAQLRPNPADRTGRVPYQYKTNADWKQYSRIIVDPVAIYSGPDNQFVKGVEDKDKAALAAYMQSQFTEKLKTRFALANVPVPNTLRLHLTLTGAKLPTPVLGPFSHLDVGGGVYNTVQAAQDKEGSLSGSVSYAVEIYDANTNTLLRSYVAKQYPNALNAAATFSQLAASKVGIDKAADALLAELK